MSTTKTVGRSMKSKATSALSRNRKPASPPRSGVSPVLVGAALLVGGLASGVLGGLVLERKKGVTGKVESKAREGQRLLEQKSQEYAEQARVTAKALKQTAEEAIYGRTDPQWYTSRADGLTIENRVIGGIDYLIAPADEGGFYLHTGKPGAQMYDQIEGPGEHGEWTTAKAVKKYVDRITKGASRPTRAMKLAANPAKDTTMAQQKKPLSNRFAFHELLDAFGLRADINEFLDYNVDSIASVGHQAEMEALREGATEAQAEEAREQAEREMYDALGSAFISAAVDAITATAEHADLVVTEVKKRGKQTLYEVTPRVSWRESLKPLIEIINGVGMFHFDSVADFLDSGPYTPREAVLRHLRQIDNYGAVYGERDMEDLFNRNLEHYLR